MKAAIMLVLLTGCAAMPDPYCKAGYEHTYSYNSGWKQILSAKHPKY